MSRTTNLGNVRTRGPRFNRRSGSGNIPISVDVDFKWHGDRVERDVDTALIQAMQWALSSAIQIVNLPGWTPFRTGDLLASIIDLGIKVEKTQVVGSFGSPIHYALFQELGTSRISGKFYLSRAGIIVGQELEKWVAKALAARGYAPRGS